MSGGARVNVDNTVCLSFSSIASYSSVIIGGDFTGPDGPEAKIDLSGGASNWLGMSVLKLADDYSNGNLAVLKSLFILGSFSDSAPITGYVIDDDGTLQPVSTGITDVAYSDVLDDEWVLLGDGRRQSPAIGDNSITKSRVGFTTAQADASIVIRLDVSSESSYDFAFISTLDNAAAASSDGYYTGSRISGTNSVTITIPVPTAGDHFVDIGYQKDGGVINGDDCAWYRVVLE
jgi:hypothetical protein